MTNWAFSITRGDLIIITLPSVTYTQILICTNRPQLPHTLCCMQTVCVCVCLHLNATQPLFPWHCAAYGVIVFLPFLPQQHILAEHIRARTPQHLCSKVAISIFEVPAPFKGSSQDAHLMWREGRLKPQPRKRLWRNCPSPSNGAKLFPPPRPVHCGSRAPGGSVWWPHVERLQGSYHSIPEQDRYRKWDGSERTGAT